MIVLPTLGADVPIAMRTRGGGAFLPGLAESLVRARVITHFDDADTPRGHVPAAIAARDERAFITAGLNAWWQPLAAPLRQWRLPLQLAETMHDDIGGATDGPPVALFGLPDETDNPPMQLRPRIEALDDEVRGFGETALAVLEDALRLLPESVSPASTLARAAWVWWFGCGDDDATVLDEARSYAGLDDAETMDEVRDAIDIVLPSDFYERIPRWVANPRRRRSRESIRRALRSPWARNVFAALDAMQVAATARPIGLRWEHQVVSDATPIGFCALLWWQQGDITGQVHDDFVNQAWEGGESIEASAAVALDLAPRSMSRWRRRVENTLRLAAATERLIELIGEEI